MSASARVIVAVLWVASVFAVGAVTSAQSQWKLYQRLPEPRVLAGDNVGFRVEGMQGDVPTGTVVIRVNGQWVEASISKFPSDR